MSSDIDVDYFEEYCEENHDQLLNEFLHENSKNPDEDNSQWLKNHFDDFDHYCFKQFCIDETDKKAAAFERYKEIQRDREMEEQNEHGESDK